MVDDDDVGIDLKTGERPHRAREVRRRTEESLMLAPVGRLTAVMARARGVRVGRRDRGAEGERARCPSPRHRLAPFRRPLRFSVGVPVTFTASLKPSVNVVVSPACSIPVPGEAETCVTVGASDDPVVAGADADADVGGSPKYFAHAAASSGLWSAELVK